MKHSLEQKFFHQFLVNLQKNNIFVNFYLYLFFIIGINRPK